MKIGILSDSHGRADRIHDAVSQLMDRGAEAIVHCGDITTPEDVSSLARPGVKAYLAAGNMDRDLNSWLLTAARNHGVDYAPDFIAVPLGHGDHLAATHGHLEHLLDELIRGGQFRYVCHGHTHRYRDEKFGDVRILNPGALWHPKGRRNCTCILLDADADTVEAIVID